MAGKHFTTALQQDTVTLLCHSDEFGKLVCQLVAVDLFEGEYRIIAERAMAYWREADEAPKMHLDTILADILEDASNTRSKTIRRVLLSMLHAQEDINAAWVLSKLRTFVRMQELKSAIIDAAEALNQPGEHTIEDVEDVLHDILQARAVQFDVGLRLSDIDRLRTHLETKYKEFTTGIRVLDDNNIVPARKQLMIFVGGAGLGKSWWMINLGKQGLLQRKKVLHISLEMEEEEVQQRYYQSIFSATKRSREVDLRTFEFSREHPGRVSGFGLERVKPDWTFADNTVDDELQTAIRLHGERMAGVLIKQFPPRWLTPGRLDAYLDSLELVEGFTPDLLLIDYPAIMKVDPRNLRGSIGDNMLACRAVAVERNIAVCAVHQLSKEGVKAASAGKIHVAEDWSIVHTADQMVVYSSTEAEQRFGLGRLYVSKARTEGDKWTVLITQNYDLGQFALNSARMPTKYFSDLQPRESDDDEQEEDNERDDDERD